MSSTEPPAADAADASGEVDDADASEDMATVVPEGPPVDDARQVVLDAITTELADDLVATETHRDDVWLRVRPQAWKRTAEVCRSVGFNYFCFLSGLDWMPATSLMRGDVVSEIDAGDEGGAEAEAQNEAVADAEPVPEQNNDADGWQTGHAGGDTRFQVFARLYSIERHIGITLKADLDEEAPAVETWSDVYPGAEWHERETWEMYGFDFVGHPHLVHLYLPGEFEGFPLRKDFPLLAREVKPWPGLVDVEPMPETDEEIAAAEPEPAAPAGAAESAAAPTGADMGTEGS